jgi:hypothetical protein
MAGPWTGSTLSCARSAASTTRDVTIAAGSLAPAAGVSCADGAAPSAMSWWPTTHLEVAGSGVARAGVGAACAWLTRRAEREAAGEAERGDGARPRGDDHVGRLPFPSPSAPASSTIW